ncbi:hypothetical protein M0805_005472 [Coniferiporia weirii]|nr:hypothetical protein M0805_005472 [Coniferiporia weirii]
MSPTRRKRGLDFLLQAVFAAAFVMRSRADQIIACNSSSTWMDNENGESPCTVAYFLMLQCTSSADFMIYPLNMSSTTYDNPLGNTTCTCNTVLYNLMSACSVCQGGDLTSFEAWTDTCANITNDYPYEAVASSYKIPKWAYVDVTTTGSFDLAAVENAAGINKHGWSAVQIAVPITIGVVITLIAAVAFYFYRRRLKQRYTQLVETAIPHHRHQHSVSSSSLGFFGGGSSSSGTLKRKASVAWKPAHLQAPRRLGGLIADRRTVHHRTRGADWSIDADADDDDPNFGPDAGKHGRSASGSGSGETPGALTKGHVSSASLASRLSAACESALNLLGADGALRPIQDSPALNTIRAKPGVARGGPRLPPVHVVSSAPARGFNLDGTDSARGSSLVQMGDTPGGSGATATAGGPLRPDGSVVLISRSPGQDFNSMASPVETEGIDIFRPPESDIFPAAFTDDSSILPPTLPYAQSRSNGSPRTPSPSASQPALALPPSQRQSERPQHPLSRILVPSPHADPALLAPSSVRAAGGYSLSQSPSGHGGPSAGSNLLPNARLFSDLTPVSPSPASAATSPTAATAAGSTHSSDAYTVPNPFTFDSRRSGGDQNPLRFASPAATPPPLPSQASTSNTNPFRGGRTQSFDLAS